MEMRDNAADYREASISFRQAWWSLQSLEFPPSIEVFETAWAVANETRPRLSPQQYAREYVNTYSRIDPEHWWT
jgi:hypothetical protein